ncbi:PAP2 superfamily protein [Tepidimonas alkaliphilus]|uniref:PAP2 superfamily protein n=1 Tax=Tepidimonas alkaliphilus TaxID=2588942 RepID=A0A554W6T6_9BURK|nr:phosphatase PAP2 family protein [Tepidimonas alkaliphilus]TSE19288.1 PAP2 superfamily protein [Tepidimonas alkaliphilus]
MKRRLDPGWWAAGALLAAMVAVQLSGADVALTHLAFDAQRGVFIGTEWAWAQALYRWVPRAGWLVLLAAAVILVWPRRRCRPAWRRAAWALWLMALVAHGLVIDLLLKDHWGRPRPRAVEHWGGSAAYQPFWQPSSACERNCSLPSGHAAAGFTVLAWGALRARRSWLRALAAGLAAGLAVGAVRVLQGAHFPTDILAAGLVVLVTGALLRCGWFRWRLRQRRRAGAQTG